MDAFRYVEQQFKLAERTSTTLSTSSRSHLYFLFVLFFCYLIFCSFTVIADDWDDDWGDEEEESIQLHGFVELGFGTFLTNNTSKTNSDLSLAEIITRLEIVHIWNDIDFSAKGDLHADGAVDEYAVSLREAKAKFSWDTVDIAVGRQILTWGTGDLLFLNDIFPKDYQSFFAGRDLEYLKASSDAIKLGYFGNLLNIDFVWMPEFEPDVYLSGERFSYFSPQAGDIVAAPPKISPRQPSEKISNSEFAIRVHDNIEGVEWALYGYRGYWGQPIAIDTNGNPIFPRLNSYGASIRSSVMGGVGNAEISYYQSVDDSSGTNPLVPNDQIRMLVGYETELIAKLTLGLQYYIEHTLDHDELLSNSFFPNYEQDESRQLITTRLNYRVNRDKLNLSLFAFYSPTDNDTYLRPAISYRIDDSWSIVAGANIFTRDEKHTFWGQFDENDNVYVRLKFSY